MKDYAVLFVAKDGNGTFAPDDAYIGNDKNRALEVAEEFRHDIKRFIDYINEYDVAVVDSTGFELYRQPFVKNLEPTSDWDEKNK